MADNVYWQSHIPDDLGPPFNDSPFENAQISYADMTALNTMPKPRLEDSAPRRRRRRHRTAQPEHQYRVFERAELLTTKGRRRDPPIEYDDNYVTVFFGETAQYPPGAKLGTRLARCRSGSA